MDSTLKPRPLPEAVFADGAPPDLDHQTRHELEVGLRRLDDLAREDPDTGEIYVDEQKLRGLLKRGLEKKNVDKVVGALRDLPDSALRAKGHPKTKPVLWEGVAQRAGVSFATAGEERGRPAITLMTTPDELRQMIQKDHPEIPDRVFEPKEQGPALTTLFLGSVEGWHPAGGREAIAADRANPFQVLWDCLVSHLGFWAAMAILGFVYGVVLSIMGALPFLSVLLWGLIVALEFLAYAVVLSVIVCVLTALAALIGAYP